MKSWHLARFLSLGLDGNHIGA